MCILEKEIKKKNLKKMYLSGFGLLLVLELAPLQGNQNSTKNIIIIFYLLLTKYDSNVVILCTSFRLHLTVQDFLSFGNILPLWKRKVDLVLRVEGEEKHYNNRHEIINLLKKQNNINPGNNYPKSYNLRIFKNNLRSFENAGNPLNGSTISYLNKKQEEKEKQLQQPFITFHNLQVLTCC